MSDNKYYTSERFIHDELMRRAAAGLDTVLEAWRTEGAVHPFVLAWPTEDLVDDFGFPIKDTVAMPLPEDKNEWPTEMKRLVDRTNPYALLLCEQRATEVVVIFESSHGTKSWHFPIYSAGSRFLGARTEKEDAETLGILWKSASAKA